MDHGIGTLQGWWKWQLIENCPNCLDQSGSMWHFITFSVIEYASTVSTPIEILLLSVENSPKNISIYIYI